MGVGVDVGIRDVVGEGVGDGYGVGVGGRAIINAKVLNTSVADLGVPS